MTRRAVLPELLDIEETTDPFDQPNDSRKSAGDIVDFTFRLPKGLLDEIKALGATEGRSANAMVAALVNDGLKKRGRAGIAGRYPAYLDYLKWERKS